MKYLLLLTLAAFMSGCRHHGYRETSMCKTVRYGYVVSTKCYEKLKPGESDEAD